LAIMRGKEMSRESIEELRIRLLRDPEIQTMIRMRAYEIYQLRGGQPGYQGEDWFRAEGEVLEFLIEEESRRASETNETEARTASASSVGSNAATSARSSVENPTAESAREIAGAEPTSSSGVWSATEPHSATLAPQIGKATEFQIDAPKKPRASSKSTSAKSASTRKAKADASAADISDKKTARSAASKKSSDSASKPKKTRKKSDEPAPASGE
jgi:DUF2934 family protein